MQSGRPDLSAEYTIAVDREAGTTTPDNELIVAIFAFWLPAR